jgi:transcription elongation factor B subunit 1
MVLEKVCEYMYYHEKHKDARDVQDMDIPPELCLELLVAADYLDRMLLPRCNSPDNGSLTYRTV